MKVLGLFYISRKPIKVIEETFVEKDRPVLGPTSNPALVTVYQRSNKRRDLRGESRYNTFRTCAEAFADEDSEDSVSELQLLEIDGKLYKVPYINPVELKFKN